jgi:hypothetical protein
MPRGKRRRKHSASQAPTAVFLAPAIGFFGFWLPAEGLLATRPHPLHWGVAFIGAAAGWVAAKAYYWFRSPAA